MVSSKIVALTSVAALAASVSAAPLADDTHLVARESNQGLFNALNSAQEGSINAQQTIDTLTGQLQRGDGHPAADVLVDAITGLDSQIDNNIAAVTSALAPLTLGASTQVGSFILGPFFQSLTNGAEVVLGNALGAPIDAVAGPLSSLGASLAKAATQASTYGNTQAATNLKSLSAKAIAVSQKSSKQARAEITIFDGLQSGVTNAQQTISSLVGQLQRGDGHPTADVLVDAITGLDSQIDNTIGTITDALGPLTFGVSTQIGGFLLGPFFQSLTNGAEVVIGNALGAPIDAIAGPISSLGASLAKAATQASTYGNTQAATNLKSLSAKAIAVSQKSSKQARAEVTFFDGLQSGVTNAQQTIGSLVGQLQRGDGHPAADVIVDAITGLDSQIDNTVGTVTDALGPLTLGASTQIGGFLLGPFFQSLTNGAEVVIGNALGAPIDAIAGPISSLGASLAKAATQASTYGNTQAATNLKSLSIKALAAAQRKN